MTGTVFVGAGYWDQAPDGIRTNGLFRLAPDGGWRSVTAGLPDAVEVRSLAERGGRLYAGTQDGPYRSDDGGESWASLDMPGLERVVWSILPLGEDVLYVGTTGNTILRSDDDGATWRTLNVPPPPGAVRMGFPMRVIRFAADAANPDEIYAGFEVGGVMRSLDGGETWTDCSTGLLDLAGEDRFKSRIGSDTEDEGMLDIHALAVSPTHPGTVILANRMGLFRSSDKGQSWTPMDIGRYSPLTYARDVQVFPHDPETLLGAFSVSANSEAGSLYRSGDFGESWTRFDHDVAINSTLMTLAVSPETPERVWCAARRGQVFGTEDGGETWREHPLPDGVQGVYAITCV